MEQSWQNSLVQSLSLCLSLSLSFFLSLSDPLPPLSLASTREREKERELWLPIFEPFAKLKVYKPLPSPVIENCLIFLTGNS